MVRKNKKVPMEHVIKGDYVLTPCRNAFSDKISFWISKRWYTKAFYCFSVSESDVDDYNRHVAEIDSYISYFDTNLELIKNDKFNEK